MGSNLGVLLLNKLLLSYWNFKQPVLLTFLHMISGAIFIWGLRALKLLSIQSIQSTQQLTKVMVLSLVFACAVLCANVSLKFLAVSMNQAIGAATPVFAAVFAFLLQGRAQLLSPVHVFCTVLPCFACL
jgi:drug/metabolite transporter (DMT)-like permease